MIFYHLLFFSLILVNPVLKVQSSKKLKNTMSDEKKDSETRVWYGVWDGKSMNDGYPPCKHCQTGLSRCLSFKTCQDIPKTYYDVLDDLAKHLVAVGKCEAIDPDTWDEDDVTEVCIYKYTDDKHGVAIYANDWESSEQFVFNGAMEVEQWRASFRQSHPLVSEKAICELAVFLKEINGTSSEFFY
jgi:ferredoxin